MGQQPNTHHLPDSAAQWAAVVPVGSAPACSGRRSRLRAAARASRVHPAAGGAGVELVGKDAQTDLMRVRIVTRTAPMTVHDVAQVWDDILLDDFFGRARERGFRLRGALPR